MSRSVPLLKHTARIVSAFNLCGRRAGAGWGWRGARVREWGHREGSSWSKRYLSKNNVIFAYSSIYTQNEQ